MFDVITKLVTYDKEQWTNFLKFSANIYKYDFNSKVLIYGQRPDATMVADMNTWNRRVGLYIKKGTKSIAVFEQGNDTRLKYLFDVKDVSGDISRVPKLWKIDKSNNEILLNNFNNIYNLNTSNFKDTIEKIVDMKTNESLKQIINTKGVRPEVIKCYVDTVKESTKYVVCRRCNLDINDENYFKYIKSFNTLSLVMNLGDSVSNISTEILREIEREIIKINIKERVNENEENHRDRISGKGRDIISSNSNFKRSETTRKVRTDGNEVSKGEKSQQIQFTFSNRGIDTTNESSGSRSRREIRRNNGRNNEEGTVKESKQHDRELETKRTSEDDSRRNSIEGDSFQGEITYPYVVVTNNQKYIKSERYSLDDLNKRIKDIENDSNIDGLIDIEFCIYYSKDEIKESSYTINMGVVDNFVEFVNLITDFSEEKLKELFPNSIEDVVTSVKKHEYNQDEDYLIEKLYIESLEKQDIEKLEKDNQIELINYKSNSNEENKLGLKAKCKNNIEAIKTLKNIENQGRLATQDEQKILAKYVGWGGLPQVFDESASSWSNEFSELKSLLNEDEYESARASTPNAHYTDTTIIKSIYNALDKFGFFFLK